MNSHSQFSLASPRFRARPGSKVSQGASFFSCRPMPQWKASIDVEEGKPVLLESFAVLRASDEPIRQTSTIKKKFVLSKRNTTMVSRHAHTRRERFPELAEQYTSYLAPQPKMARDLKRKIPMERGARHERRLTSI